MEQSTLMDTAKTQIGAALFNTQDADPEAEKLKVAETGRGHFMEFHQAEIASLFGIEMEVKGNRGGTLTEPQPKDPQRQVGPSSHQTLYGYIQTQCKVKADQFNALKVGAVLC